MKPNHPQAIPVRRLLRKYDLRPKKQLGQNFLTDGNSLRKVVDAARIKESDVVLEIGPGLGSLTRYLAVEAYHVVAVELDSRFLPPLQEVLALYDNVTIILGDILDQNIETLLSKVVESPGKGYIVVANIPYYITSAVIRHLIDAEIRPDRMVLTVQREVAIRICAQPPDLSLLALSVQVFGSPTIAAKIPAGAFYPPPRVDSAVIRVEIFPSPLIPPPYLKTFFQLVKAGFGQKRKVLRNSLSAGLGISKSRVESILIDLQIDPNRRAETLSLDEWRALSVYYQDLRVQ
jgi:16S rRNA (adenine1518-N6/adenine1519-N6)-dimethyltransferase